MRLKDKVAIVTGAASGIGKAAVHRFVEEGARVVLGDIDADGLRATSADLGEAVHTVPTDVSVPEDVEHLANTAVERFGTIDVLFSNAGIEFPSTVTEIDPADWNRVISVNLSSVFLCAKYVLPHMIENGGGSIINTASQLGLVGYRNFAVYNAAKGGVVNLTRNMALDYAEHNVRVNAICPGPIDTPHIERQVAGLDPQARDEAYRSIAGLVPLGRLGTAEEIADGVLFLASDESSFMTGANLVIDGGYTAK